MEKLGVISRGGRRVETRWRLHRIASDDGRAAQEYGSDAQLSRNPAAIGRRAARMAGKRPPRRPSNVAEMIAWVRRDGVTANAKATWLKV